MKKLKKYSIGIFGGSFDPPHYGHLKISIAGIKKLKLDKVIWLVTEKNPLKNKTFFSLKTRIKKCRKIIKNKKKINILFIEKKIKSKRIIDSIIYLKKKSKTTDFYLLLGSDNLINFHKWNSWKKITKLTTLAIFSRKGYDNKINKTKVLKFLDKKRIIFIKNKKIDISSTKIRKNLI